VTAKEIKQLEF